MKKFIISIVIIIIFLLVTIGLSLISGKSNSSVIDDNLTSNNYILNSDKKIYRKIINGNTLDDFYKNSSNDINNRYEEYTFNTISYDLVLFSIVYQNNNYYTCTITDNLQTENTNYNCEFTYKNKSYLFTGYIENNSINCENKKLSQKVLDSYCSYIGKRIDEYNNEKNSLISNEEFYKVIKKQKQEIKEEN